MVFPSPPRARAPRQRRSPRKLREAARHFAIHLAPERHHEIGESVKALPAPGVELGRLAVARRQGIDLALASREAQREPSLPLAAKIPKPMGRAVIGRKLVRQPIGLAEIAGVAYAGLFP